LQKLWIPGNDQITDAGLVHLKGLTNLECLDVKWTKVTEAGVKDLQKALPKCAIDTDWKHPPFPYKKKKTGY
jgi:hypothetical protein